MPINPDSSQISTVKRYAASFSAVDFSSKLKTVSEGLESETTLSVLLLGILVHERNRAQKGDVGHVRKSVSSTANPKPINACIYLNMIQIFSDQVIHVR